MIKILHFDFQKIKMYVMKSILMKWWSCPSWLTAKLHSCCDEYVTDICPCKHMDGVQYESRASSLFVLAQSPLLLCVLHYFLLHIEAFTAADSIHVF